MSKSARPHQLAVVFLCAVVVGCSSQIKFNVYPPGALVTVEGSCVSPCTLEVRRVAKELHYRIEKEPLYRSTEGIIQARVARGRVVASFFTFGIVAIARGIYYVPAALAQLDPVSDPARDLAIIHEHGTGRIEGQAFTETRGGEVRHAAGDTITLLPDTPYVRDAVEYLAFKTPPAEGQVTSEPNLQFLDEYKRQALGDAEGRFAFEGLAPGKYIIAAVIRWEAVEPEVGLAPQLVDVVGFAEVQEGTTTTTLATDWVEQESGIGQRGEAAMPRISPEAEKMGQRRVPNREDADHPSVDRIAPRTRSGSDRVW
jgi:hypothetical protein